MFRRFSGSLVMYQRYGIGADDRKPVRKGTLPALNSWARLQGLEFVRETGSLFGGYWVDEAGNGYEVDVM
jgi:hypothetical protein